MSWCSNKKWFWRQSIIIIMYHQNLLTYVFVYFVPADFSSEDQLHTEEKQIGPCFLLGWDAVVDWLTYILLVAWISRTLDIWFSPVCHSYANCLAANRFEKRPRLWQTAFRLILSLWDLWFWETPETFHLQQNGYLSLSFNNYAEPSTWEKTFKGSFNTSFPWPWNFYLSCQ